MLHRRLDKIVYSQICSKSHFTEWLESSKFYNKSLYKMSRWHFHIKTVDGFEIWGSMNIWLKIGEIRNQSTKFSLNFWPKPLPKKICARPWNVTVNKIPLPWKSMNRHMIALLQGDTVISSSMFFLTELYSLKHHAKLTIETPMEKIWAVSIPRRAKSNLTVPSGKKDQIYDECWKTNYCEISIL